MGDVELTTTVRSAYRKIALEVADAAVTVLGLRAYASVH